MRSGRDVDDNTIANLSNISASVDVYKYKSGIDEDNFWGSIDNYSALNGIYVPNKDYDKKSYLTKMAQGRKKIDSVKKYKDNDFSMDNLGAEVSDHSHRIGLVSVDSGRVKDDLHQHRTDSYLNNLRKDKLRPGMMAQD